MTPATVDLRADRFTPFKQQLSFPDLILTDAVVAMQIRLYPNAPGAPVVNLFSVGAPNTEGLLIDSVTTITIFIAEATMEALPQQSAEIGNDDEFFYDLHITPAGGVKQVYVRGKFIVRGGATQ